MAFTAARWSLYCCTGRRLELFHTSSCTGTRALEYAFTVESEEERFEPAHLVVVASRRQVLVVRRPLQTTHFLPVTLQPSLSARGGSDVPLQDHSIPTP